MLRFPHSYSPKLTWKLGAAALGSLGVILLSFVLPIGVVGKILFGLLLETILLAFLFVSLEGMPLWKFSFLFLRFALLPRNFIWQKGSLIPREAEVEIPVPALILSSIALLALIGIGAFLFQERTVATKPTSLSNSYIAFPFPELGTPFLWQVPVNGIVEYALCFQGSCMLRAQEESRASKIGGAAEASVLEGGISPLRPVEIVGLNGDLGYAFRAFLGQKELFFPTLKGRKELVLFNPIGKEVKVSLRGEKLTIPPLRRKTLPIDEGFAGVQAVQASAPIGGALLGFTSQDAYAIGPAIPLEEQAIILPPGHVYVVVGNPGGEEATCTITFYGGEGTSFFGGWKGILGPEKVHIFDLPETKGALGVYVESSVPVVVAGFVFAGDFAGAITGIPPANSFCFALGTWDYVAPSEILALNLSPRPIVLYLDLEGVGSSLSLPPFGMGGTQLRGGTAWLRTSAEGNFAIVRVLRPGGRGLILNPGLPCQGFAGG